MSSNFSVFSPCAAVGSCGDFGTSLNVGEQWLYRATGSNPGVLIVVITIPLLMRSVEMRSVL